MMTDSSESKLRFVDETFDQRFGGRRGKIVVRSPGRINLIGEHTDYNEGFVMPAAIDKAVWFVAAGRPVTGFGLGRAVCTEMVGSVFSDSGAGGGGGVSPGGGGAGD